MMEAQLLMLEENGVHLAFEITGQGDARLLHCGPAPFAGDSLPEKRRACFRAVELQCAGENQDDHHGSKYTGTLPGGRLRFEALRDTRNQRGRLIELVQNDPITGLRVTSRYQFFGGPPVLEASTLVENLGGEPRGLSYCSSFALTGLTKSALAPWDEAARLMIPGNTWYGEFQWKDYSTRDLGLYKVFHYSTNRISVASTGTWTSHEHLPMAYLENRESLEGWMFSIAHNGSWQWEISDCDDQLALRVSGPTENEGHWYKSLNPGESFESVPVAVAVVSSGFEGAAAAMTDWRREVRRPNRDDRELPVIFNDFMNCLNGDPTEKKLLPLIDAAADLGCEYFTIDAGWYADGSWWERVGEWEPAAARFPSGLEAVLARIRERGMVPGLWLEPEVIGVRCPLAKELPDDCFFCRHGKRVIDHGRYQLDFRNPRVREFADSVVERMVEKYGAGYIKMDYNIDAGIGTELEADSFGDGLLDHNRAYLGWLDGLFARWPELIIENCGSGGMRINDALLCRHSIQSSSDQTNYLRYAAIAAASPTAVTPEQSAVWSYPLEDADEEQAAFNMVNAMLLRIHQSGHLARLAAPARERVREGLDYYKRIRAEIPNSHAFWPSGLPAYSDGRASLGMRNDHWAHVALWRMGDDADVVSLELGSLKKAVASVELAYPKGMPCDFAYHPESNTLTVRQPQNSARLFRVNYCGE